MARRAIWAAFQPNGILIAIHPSFNNMEKIAAALSLYPKGLAASRPKRCFATL
jgi:hypothetical protein